MVRESLIIRANDIDGSDRTADFPFDRLARGIFANTVVDSGSSSINRQTRSNIVILSRRTLLKRSLSM